MYRDKKVIHIVAVAQNNVIGKDNDLCWRIKEDLQYFKQQTLGHVCLAGSKTVGSFPKPLERRVVYKVTSKPTSGYLQGTLNDVLIQANTKCHMLNTSSLFIIGGSHLYKSTEDIVDELWITEIKETYEGDTYYVKPEGFVMYNTTEWFTGLDIKTQKDVQYRFTKWQRSNIKC